MSRLVWGFSIAGVNLTLILLGGWWWTATVAFVLWQGFKELLTILNARGVNPSHRITLGVGMLLIMLAHFRMTELLLPTLAFGFIAGFIRLLFRQPRATIHDIGGTFLSIFYLGFLPMHFILLRNLSTEPAINLPYWVIDQGAIYVFFTVITIAMSDAGAYFVGKWFGKHPLYPAISPKKTREGAIGGLIFGMIGGLGFLLTDDMSVFQALSLSALLVLGGLLGDLSESLMKRDAGVKDSGTIFHSHGGLLDRFDSYMFCGAIAYYYIYWWVQHQGLSAQWWDQFYQSIEILHFF